MNFRQLRYFVQVVDSGNMTRAAELLRDAQPALGMQIKQLEEELGVALLVRHSRGVEVTEAGQRLHARARAILLSVEEARQEAIGAAGAGLEAVKLGLTPSLMQVIGPGLALRMAESAPDVALSLSEEMSHLLVDTLKRGELDMILAYEVPAEGASWRRALYREDLVFVSAGEGGLEAPICFSAVVEAVLVLPERRDSVRALLDRTAADLGVELRVAHEIRSVSGMKSLVQRGVACGVLPFGTVMSDVKAGLLTCRPIVSPSLRRTLYLAGSRRAAELRSAPRIDAVIDEVMATLAHAMGALGHRLPAEGAAL
jgi:LysR family transcriptional regulator, nitrogen assimilation regulatory protein